MSLIEFNCPYCNDEHTIEIENQMDGDYEEIQCDCGKKFDVEISFSVECIVHEKDEEVEE